MRIVCPRLKGVRQMKRSRTNFWYYLQGLSKITISLRKSVAVSRFETAPPPPPSPTQYVGRQTLRMRHYKSLSVVMASFNSQLFVFQFQKMHTYHTLKVFTSMTPNVHYQCCVFTSNNFIYLFSRLYNVSTSCCAHLTII